MRILRWALWALSALAALYIYFAALHPLGQAPDHALFEAPGPWAMAHRGGRGLWPENTLYAFERAQTLGVDVIEMDIRATADGVLVAMHDATVDRTTNGTGRVDGMTLAQIRKLDAGYRFESASGESTYRGEGVVVPTLEEVLSRFGKARLNVEMKDFTPDLASELCRLLERYEAMDRVLVASFDNEPMAAFRESCPLAATSATFREGLTLHQLGKLRLTSLFRSPALALQMPETLGGQRVLDQRFLEVADRLNIKVQVWTVNEEAGMKRLLEMGVQGILTDYPDRLLRLMSRMEDPAR